MNTITILHGSDHIIRQPDILLGKPYNDYGKGFYCTMEMELAKEWACKSNANGFVNAYEIDMDGLQVLNLLDGKHNILNWIALLLQHRTFETGSEIALDAKEYIIDNFSINLQGFDAVIGYRADDSYFSYASSFIENGIPLRSLNRALYLGKLGTQIAIKSAEGFDRLKFVKAEPASKEIYYPKFVSRDQAARQSYRDDVRKVRVSKDDIFVMDILREEMKPDDARIRQIVSA